MVNLDESIEKEIESIYANIKREVKHLQNYNKEPSKE
jgi:cell division protein ZapA (FtsZ GTPase activity inhibitor)